MMDEVSELEEELQRLKSTPRAMTVTGRDNKIIAVIHGEGTGEVKPGMVVLFSSSPSQAGLEVALIEYQVRTNPKTNKQYVKCFRWVESSVIQKTVTELEKKLEELRKAEREAELQRIHQENLQALSQLGLGEEALKLLEIKEYDALASLLMKSGAKVVLWESDYGRFIVIDERAIELTLNDNEIKIRECELPVRFEPEKWLTSEEQEIISVDCEVKAKSLIAKTGWRSFLLLPKGIAEKIKKIKDSKLDEETKKRLYEALLGDKK
jgi:hypothetical protein